MPMVVICALSGLADRGLRDPAGPTSRTVAQSRHGVSHAASARPSASASAEAAPLRVFEGWLPNIAGGAPAFPAALALCGTAATALAHAAGGVRAHRRRARSRSCSCQPVDAETVTSQARDGRRHPRGGRRSDMLARIEPAALAEKEEVKTIFAVDGCVVQRSRTADSPSDPAVVGQVTHRDASSVPTCARPRVMRTSQDAPLRTARARRPISCRACSRLSFQRTAPAVPSGPDLEIRVRGDDLDAAPARPIVLGAREDQRVRRHRGDVRRPRARQARGTHAPTRRSATARPHDRAMWPCNSVNALFGFEVQELQIGEDEVTVRVMLPGGRTHGHSRTSAACASVCPNGTGSRAA